MKHVPLPGRVTGIKSPSYECFSSFFQVSRFQWNILNLGQIYAIKFFGHIDLLTPNPDSL